MTDLTYTQNDTFTSFIAQTTAGESPWREMANKLGGTATVLNSEAKNVIAQLRKAGYKVIKARKATKKEMAEIFAEMEALGL